MDSAGTFGILGVVANTDASIMIKKIECLTTLFSPTIIWGNHQNVIKCADWVIGLDLGGGESGGHIVAQGPPEDIAYSPHSITGKYLSPLIFIN